MDNRGYKLTIALLLIAICILSLFLIPNDNEMIKEKTFLNSVVLKAIGTNDDSQEKYFKNLVDNDLLSEKVKHDYFDFSRMDVNSFWKKFEIGSDTIASVKINEKINEDKNNNKTYLVITSYKYPVNAEAIGHELISTNVDSEVYMKFNRVLLFTLDKNGKIIDLEDFKDSAFIGTGKYSKGIQPSDLESGESHNHNKERNHDLHEIKGSEGYINDLINGDSNE